MNVRNVKILKRKSLLGRILRLPFKLIPENAVLPIVSGLLKGKYWIKGSHNISVLLGTYERFQSREFFDSCSKAKIFWDLGAHVGYYSLLYSVGNPAGKIFAFEPLQRNGEIFIKHMKVNNISGFNLYSKAVSNEVGTLLFKTGRTTVAGKLSHQGDTIIEVVRLSEWVAKNVIEIPNLIKMDIEGEEYKVLQDLKIILGQYRPKIFLSTHGHDVHQACISLLSEINYSFKPLDSPKLESCREVLAF